MILEGYQNFHIPGSFPIATSSDATAEDIDMLIDFDKSNVCKDSRIFIHCWAGDAANAVAKTLIEVGFTNVHAAGPQGTAGIWDWKAAGYELVYNDTFSADEKRFQPECLKHCDAM